MGRMILQTEFRELNTASSPTEDYAWHFTSAEKKRAARGLLLWKSPLMLGLEKENFSSTQNLFLEVLLSLRRCVKGQIVNKEQIEPCPWEDASYLKRAGVMFLNQNMRQREHATRLSCK